MAVRIPTSNVPFYTEVVTLDGVAYTLDFAWNTRDETWRMGIATASGNAIVRSLKVLPAVNMTARFKDTRLPTTGSFVCINTKDSITAPGRDGLVEEVQIWFLSTEELALLPAGFAEVV